MKKRKKQSHSLTPNKLAKTHEKKLSEQAIALREFDEGLIEHLRGKHRHPLNLFFNLFAKHVADLVGNAFAFALALLAILLWGISGRYFNYSDTWQLIINTATTIITFLIVFLIQNTQNRDTEILNLKMDELIRAHKGAKNPLINLADLSDAELKELEKEYLKLLNKRTGT